MSNPIFSSNKQPKNPAPSLSIRKLVVAYTKDPWDYKKKARKLCSNSKNVKNIFTVRDPPQFSKDYYDYKVGIQNKQTISRRGNLLHSKKQHEYSIPKSETHRRIKSTIDKECTFKPVINPSSRRSRARSDQQIKCTQHLESNEVQMECQISTKPQICSASQKIMELKPYSRIPCHSRLYGYQKNKSKKQIVANLLSKEFHQQFSPKILKDSKGVNRNGSITKNLYQDAIRRQSKVSNSSDRTCVYSLKTSSNILYEKLKSELGTILKEFQQSLTYSQFRIVAKRLDLGENNRQIELLRELWCLVANQRIRVPIQDLKVALLGMMGHFQSWMSQNSGYSLTRKSAKQLHERFLPLYNHRVSANLQIQNSKQIPKFKKPKVTSLHQRSKSGSVKYKHIHQKLSRKSSRSILCWRNNQQDNGGGIGYHEWVQRILSINEQQEEGNHSVTNSLSSSDSMERSLQKAANILL